MKHKCLYILFSILFISSFENSASGQEYTCPDFQIIGDYNSNNYTVIYPIGWSKNGNFAYLHHNINPLGGATIYDYEVRIQNMRSGIMHWVGSFEYDVEDDPTAYNLDSIPADTTKFGDSFLRYYGWPDNYEDVSATLSKFEIIQQPVPISNIPFFLSENIELVEEADYNPDNTYCIISYMIRMSTKAKRVSRVLYFYEQKALDSGQCKDEDGNLISYHKFEIRGYFKSPYEDLYVMYVVESVEGDEEPWEHPFLVYFAM